ncbi:MAG: SRPBCC family protein [Pyrinomonadaceae bacterium]|nr:SRPBCC family protein [Phycisphaerales bacterium]
MVKPYELEVSMFVPLPIERVFAFFADASNLEAITPQALRFQILTPRPIEMQPGAMIDYKLRLHGVPIRWRSEITAYQPPVMFVDEQRTGPYKLWRHEHRFESTTDAGGTPGTQVRDTVTYVPRGGRLIHRLFVRPELEKIFRHRQARILELLLNAPPGEVA